MLISLGPFAVVITMTIVIKARPPAGTNRSHTVHRGRIVPVNVSLGGNMPVG